MNQSLQKLVRVSVLLGVILFAVSGYIWWNQIVTNPSRVFWNTLDKNLSTNSVVRSIEFEQQGSASKNVTAVSLLGEANAQTVNAITDMYKNSVTTETILTPNATYTRILDVDSEAEIAQSKLSGLFASWAKEDLTGDVASADLIAAIAGNVPSFPVAQLSKEQRSKIMTYVRDNKVFEFNQNEIKKTTKDGRKVYEYTVTIHPESYIAMMKLIGEMTGINEHESIDPSLYKDQAPVTETISIDVMSRRVLSVVDGSGVTEKYSSYGTIRAMDLPKDTITFEELQQRFAEIAV